MRPPVQSVSIVPWYWLFRRTSLPKLMSRRVRLDGARLAFDATLRSAGNGK
jgi:hypothetical protein